MTDKSHFRLQLVIFSLVSAAFTNIYITQPILPVLQSEFSADMVIISFTVSAVILGIALANLPFGILADRFPIQPIILIGGIFVALAGLICAITANLWILIGGRFVQGLFIPALTTCLAAHLAKILPVERLNVVMASYISATVLGGLGGRLLGGFIHPPLHWRYAFFSASALVFIATLIGVWGLPKNLGDKKPEKKNVGFVELMKQPDLLRIFFCSAGSFAIFSSIFNYLPFRLDAPPFSFTTQQTTMLYSAYVIGIFIGPFVGRISNRFGSGPTLISGSAFLGISLVLILIPWVPAVVVGLIGTVAGFFTIHAAAVGNLNRKISSGQGRANALYVLFYYLGGWLGITCSGFLFRLYGWTAVIGFCILLLLIPLYSGYREL